MKKLFLLITIFQLTTCATLITSINKKKTFSNEEAYLYGKFYQERSAAVMTLVLKNNETNKDYDIEIEEKGLIDKKKYKEVKMFALPPGIYQFTAVATSYTQMGFQGNKTITSSSSLRDQKFSENFRVKKGQIYYVGDFVGQSSSMGLGVGSFLKVQNNYQKTTSELKEKFPNFKDIKTRHAFEGNDPLFDK